MKQFLYVTINVYPISHKCTVQWLNFLDVLTAVGDGSAYLQHKLAYNYYLKLSVINIASGSI